MTDLKRLLPRSYYAFLGRFARPTEIQSAAIPTLLEGRDALLCSATASGKTEAYMAALVERHFDALKQEHPVILVLSPTRALVNDLTRRLEPPLGRAGLAVTRRTGDRAHSLERCGAIVVTTPESLDSVLSRHPRWLGQVRSVVLDELHVLAPGPRGSQLEMLLGRLERVTRVLSQARPQRVAASATVEHSQLMAGRFLGPEAVTVQVPSQRQLEYRGRPGHDPETILSSIVETCRELGARKVLTFVPSRADAEALGAALVGRPPFQRQVLVHHASLSRQERERVESSFLRSASALILATPTLELGLDIGNIDLVTLLGAPPDISSFLQRAGRGNRRGGLCQVLGLYRSAAEELRLEHLAERASEGRLLETPGRFWRSVLVQQAFSLLYQNPNRFLNAAALQDRLPASVAGLDCQELLDQLVEEQYLEMVGERYLPAPKLERLFQRGWMHGNLDTAPDEDLVDVVEAHSGRVVGQVRREADGSLPDQLALGGRARRVRSHKGNRVTSEVDAQGSADTRFATGSSPLVSRVLAQDLARHMGLGPGEAWIARHTRGAYLGHFQGTVWGQLLAALIGGRAQGDAFVCVVDGDFDPERLDPTALTLAIEKRSRKLARSLGAGPWVRCLPPAWLQAELESAVEAQELRDYLTTVRWREVPEKLDLLAQFRSRIEKNHSE